MISHRTTARGALLLLTLAASVAAATWWSPSATAVGVGAAAKPRILFPVVGPAEYGNDYGDPRPNGSHAGIDIVTEWRTPAIAAEAGTLKFWVNARAGCMLYLYGRSGTTYLYIHLNNDLTKKRDNRGECVPGVAFADGLKDGAKVDAGQEIAYNGDSGDAEGTYHLHFEVHPNDGADVSPFPYLNRAEHRLFPGVVGRPFAAGIRGVPIAAGKGTLTVRATAVRWWPNGRWVPVTPQAVEVDIAEGATVDSGLAAALVGSGTRTPESTSGVVNVFTAAMPATDEALRGEPGALAAVRVTRAGGETVVWEAAASDDGSGSNGETDPPPDDGSDRNR
jgi:hypothetical protein